MVGVDIETIGLPDLSQFKIKGYKLDDDITYNTEAVCYTKEENEDDFIEFTMVPEFDALGYEIGAKGVNVQIYERCSTIEILHFSPNVTWNALQAFLDRKFGQHE